MHRPESPAVDPVAVVLVVTPHLLDALVAASVTFQRQRRVDGLGIDLELADLVTALAGARPGPPGTSLDVEGDGVHGDDRLLYTYTEAAGLLAISERHVKRLVSQGRLRRVRLGAAARIPASDLTNYVNDLRERAT